LRRGFSLIALQVGVLLKLEGDWKKFSGKDTEELEERESGVMKGEEDLLRMSSHGRS
jgi:hypothetical protein